MLILFLQCVIADHAVSAVHWSAELYLGGVSCPLLLDELDVFPNARDEINGKKQTQNKPANKEDEK